MSQFKLSAVHDENDVQLKPMEVTEQQVSQLRLLLKHPRAINADVATVKRFIRATGGNLPLSAKRLNHTSEWQEKEQPEKRVCKACAKDPHSHYMHVSAYCLSGRPIIYSCLALASNKVFDDNRDHMLQTFETAIKVMHPGVEQWVWVCDFHGFGMADVNPRLAKLFLDLSAEHYPERLGLFMVVDAPSLFGVLWKAISHFVDPKTYRKIRFVPFDYKGPGTAGTCTLEQEMLQHFSPETTSWMLAEMQENRNKRMAAHKPYNVYSIYEQALQGQLCDQHSHHPSAAHKHTSSSTPATATAPDALTIAADEAAAALAAAMEPSPSPSPTTTRPLHAASKASNGNVLNVVAQQEEVAVAEEGLAGLKLSAPPSSGGAAAGGAVVASGKAQGAAGGAAKSSHHSRHPSAQCHCHSGVHDFRGTAELLHLYNTRPEVLLPQAMAS